MMIKNQSHSRTYPEEFLILYIKLFYVIATVVIKWHFYNKLFLFKHSIKGSKQSHAFNVKCV